MKKAEVMAPAGSFASLQAAIDSGCDSVFFGVKQLNMRARSSVNFSIEDLHEIVDRCKKAKIRSYLTMNTILYEHDIKLMKLILDEAKKAGVTAVIIADLAAMQYAKEIGLSIHASTQLSISNYESVKFFAQFVDTVVLAREVDLTMMKKICDKIKKEQLKGPAGELIKVEVFVHGALCIAQSGRCHMSIIQTNTSAQRGACLQECRKKYRIIDDETGRELMLDNQYVLSPKDLCTIDFLDRIIDAGIEILKIEGRGRNPQYVSTVVKVYREAVDAIYNKTYTKEQIEIWKKELATVYNRGFSDGYYLGKPLPDWAGTYGNQATQERVFIGLVEHYFPKAEVAEINLQAHGLKKDDDLVIMGSNTGVKYAKVSEIQIAGESVAEANHPNTVTIKCSEKIRKNDKVYILKNREIFV